ncbi:MAG: T9SS type A sorting domain-containing protein [Cyclobacteriaceae bacterium]
MSWKFFCKGLMIVGLMTASLGQGIANAPDILLPVEVLGVDQTTESRSFQLVTGSEAKWLFMQVNNFSLEGKVEVSFNNSGKWTALTNSNVTIPSPDSNYGGIGGGYSTVRIYFDISSEGLLDGDNTVAFRFNAANDKVSIGYRVVDFNILNESKNELIASEDFVEDDPSTWQPPSSDTQDIADGENLWRTAVLTEPVMGTILASCADCHAQDGRDLKYFNYSNKSIVKRSEYHGLTEEEGEKITSYIRNLDVPAPAGARPWNPPYQPGPGLDSKPVEEWAAGAGLDMVLDSDEEMLPYFFPNGTSDEELEKVFDLKGTLNIREMPVALQFPDWNRWLPRVHPKDMMTGSSYEEMISGIGFGGRSAGNYGYSGIRADFEANEANTYNNSRDALSNKLFQLGAGVQDFLFKNWTDAGGVFWWTVLASPGLSKNTTNLLREEFKMNLAQWNSVKHWEIMQEFGVEGLTPKNEPYAEHAQWPFSNWTVFAIAPHIVGDVRGTSRFQGQAQEVGYYFSTAWYQLQLTLNAGMRRSNRVAPVDWAYNFMHITEVDIYTGFHEPLRLFQNLLKAYQQRDNDVIDNNNSEVNHSAWNMREVSPWRLYSNKAGNTIIHDKLNEYEEGLRNKIAGHMLNAFMDKVTSLQVSDWLRGFDEWHLLEPADYEPQTNPPGACLFPNPSGNGCSNAQNTNEADAMYTVIPLFQQIGMDCDAVENLRQWSAEIWPLGDWDRYIQGACTGIYLQDVDLLVELNESVQHTLVGDDQITMSELDLRDGLNIYATASSEVGSVVFDLNNGEHTSTDNQYPFALFGDGNDYTDWAISPGTYTLNIKAYEQANGAGTVLDEDDYSLTVVKGTYLKGISLIQQSTNQLITNLTEDEDYNVGDFPMVLLNIRARTDAENHVGSMTFDLDNGTRVFTDNLTPFKLYGDGSEFSSWVPDIGTHSLNVKVYGDVDGAGDLIDEATYTYTFSEEPITGIEGDFVEIKVYPNPATSMLTLDRHESWKVVSMQGQELNRGSSKTIDIKSLLPGMYLLEASGKVLRFIKQ